MPLSNRDPFSDNAAHLKTFPDHVLLDIARNDAAQKPYRLLAVEILQLHHPFLNRDGIIAMTIHHRPHPLPRHPPAAPHPPI